MAVRNVIVEIRRRPELETILFGAGILGGAEVVAATNAVSTIHGFTLDLSFPPVTVPPGVAPGSAEAATAAVSDTDASSPAMANEAALELPEFDTDTLLVRGVIDESQFDASALAAGPLDGVVGVFADPVIEPAIVCGNSPPLGTAGDVSRLLAVTALRRARMSGQGVMVAIVDTGINLAHLRSRLGSTPRFSSERSWVPPLQPGQLPMTPGQMPVGHGTMCAFDALIAAPAATLLDIAVLASRRPGGSAMDGLLSDAVLGYSHLLRVMRSIGRPGDFHSLVVNNSWGMFRQSWDFPPGHPGNYSDNPNHPFNRIVGTLERAGADILFAAGNCGRECPDNRCGTEQDAGIYGANSHPAVLCVAGVDVRKRRVGYSTRGPGRLARAKPDVAGFTHFKGSDVYPADGGTSAATPVVAGLVAAFRSRFPTTPQRPPAMVRELLRRTAEDVGTSGFDMETGFGIVDGARLARSMPTPTEEAEERERERDLPEVGGDTVGGEMENVSDDDLLRALRDFGLVAPNLARSASNGPCEGCGATTVEQTSSFIGEMTMANADSDFLQALQQFGYQEGAAGATASVGGEFGEADSGFTGFGMEAEEDDQALFQALAAYGGASGAAAGAMAVGADVTAAPSLAAVCRTWGSVRSIVLRILPFLGAIPGIGAALAAALRTLGALLDAVCRGGQPQQLCQRWRGGLRTIVVRIASVVGRIPIIGGAAGRGITALIAAIDALCRGV